MMLLTLSFRTFGDRIQAFGREAFLEIVTKSIYFGDLQTGDR